MGGTFKAPKTGYPFFFEKDCLLVELAFLFPDLAAFYRGRGVAAEQQVFQN